MASAMEKAPKRNRPCAPWRPRQSFQIASMRASSAATSGVLARPGISRRTFIGIWLRTLVNPECISALTLRAWARAAASGGQSCFFGCFSARYSQIASESQTVRLSSCSTGTLPAAEYCRIFCLAPLSYRDTRISSKPMPACLISSHGRNDHDEYALLPITRTGLDIGFLLRQARHDALTTANVEPSIARPGRGVQPIQAGPRLHRRGASTADDVE